MSVIINPGSGPVDGADRGNATENMLALMLDLAEAGATVADLRSGDPDGDGDGRWTFVLTVNGKDREVDMPGLPLDRVRWVDGEDQNIWDFPRLYVDGSSWVWAFAVNVLVDTDDDEDES